MFNADPQRRERALRRLVQRAERRLERATRLSASVSRWRMALFLTAAVVLVLIYRQAWYHLGNGLLALFLLTFFTIAHYHNRLEDGMQRLLLWLSLKRAHLGRLTLDWAAIPARLTPTPDNHSYARDLDITGPHSLFHLLNTTILSNGRERLASWLLDQTGQLPEPTAWLERQELAKELTRMPLFRDRLALAAIENIARPGSTDTPEIDGLRIWAALQSPAGFAGLVPLFLLEGALTAATWGLGLSWALGLLPAYWVVSFLIYSMLQLLTSGQTAPVFGRALSLHHELNRLGNMIRYLERRHDAHAPALKRLCRSLLEGDQRPSTSLGKLASVCQALSIRAHPLVYLAVNALMPWDLFWTLRLETLRQSIQTVLPGWLDKLAELDAASALATFAYLHPDYHWPKPTSGISPTHPGPLFHPPNPTLAERQAFVPETRPLPDSPIGGNGRPVALVARAAGHPLLPRGKRVTNDVELKGLGRILLITGSNMSGKSTFLRTIGVNTCLAQAGAPVCAASFEWTWMRIACCIRVDDSLEAGLSFFYAEVKRLKRLLDAAGDPTAPPVLFLIDEIFKGTNNRERLIGSRAFIQSLAGGNGLGLITTHDLELAQLEQELPAATNVHFQETVEANELKFDYLLRPGPCPTTNALRIMALEGLPVPDQRT